MFLSGNKYKVLLLTVGDKSLVPYTVGKTEIFTTVVTHADLLPISGCRFPGVAHNHWKEIAGEFCSG